MEIVEMSALLQHTHFVSNIDIKYSLKIKSVIVMRATQPMNQFLCFFCIHGKKIYMNK